MPANYKSPLSNVELHRASGVIAYAELLRKVGRVDQQELQTTADELQAILTTSLSGTLRDKMAARRKAKKVVRHLRRAALHARAMAVCGVKFRKTFEMEYAELLNPTKVKKSMDWKG